MGRKISNRANAKEKCVTQKNQMENQQRKKNKIQKIRKEYGHLKQAHIELFEKISDNMKNEINKTMPIL